MRIDFATAAGHWYGPAGEPRYTIVGKNGAVRNTTIRDARAHGLVPSVTTILRVANKPALTNWLIDQALMSALTLPKIDGESLDDFKRRAKHDSEQQSKNAADAGTGLHASLEAHFKGGMVPSDHIPHCVTTERALTEAGFTGPWEAERSFANEQYGYGGKLDLSSANCVVDFKTKAELEGGKKYAYDEHGMQLAAYAHGLDRPDADLVNVFIGIKDGAVLVHVWPREERARLWEMFRALHAYWKLANNFADSAAKRGEGL